MWGRYEQFDQSPKKKSSMKKILFFCSAVACVKCIWIFDDFDKFDSLAEWQADRQRCPSKISGKRHMTWKLLMIYEFDSPIFPISASIHLIDFVVCPV